MPDLLTANGGSREGTDSTEAYHVESASSPHQPVGMSAWSRSSPLEDMIVQEYLKAWATGEGTVIEIGAFGPKGD